ncbi:hypothetical protein HYV31_03345 [candidate division WWE3 bacterium]|nr:hypothetical protein [candidate division WWE3 bacterium]
MAAGIFIYSSYRTYPNVRGTNTQSQQSKTGLELSVVSTNTSWEMLKYLCISESDCLESLDAGRRLSKVSGSPTELRDISESPDDTWKEFKFLKVYVRSSLSLINSSFSVLTLGDVPGTLMKVIPFGNAKVNVALIPIEPLLSSFYKSATFSDR